MVDKYRNSKLHATLSATASKPAPMSQIHTLLVQQPAHLSLAGPRASVSTLKKKIIGILWVTPGLPVIYIHIIIEQSIN